MKIMAERTKCTILLYITERTMQQETYYFLAGTYQACCKLVMNNIRWSNIMINCYNKHLAKTFNLQELIKYDILYHYITQQKYPLFYKQNIRIRFKLKMLILNQPTYVIYLNKI